MRIVLELRNCSLWCLTDHVTRQTIDVKAHPAAPSCTPQVQCAGFLVHRPKSASDFKAPDKRSV